MAISGTEDILGAAIRADIQAALTGITDQTDMSVADQLILMRAWASAIISHLVTYGVAVNSYSISAVSTTSYYSFA